MRFVPRIVYEADVLASSPDRIELSEGLSRFYDITEITYFNGRYYQITAVDRAEDVLHIKDVTDKVTVNGEPA